MEGIKCDVKGCNEFGQHGGVNPWGGINLSGDWVSITGPLGTHHAHNYEHASELAAQLQKEHENNKASEQADAEERQQQAENVRGKG